MALSKIILLGLALFAISYLATASPVSNKDAFECNVEKWRPRFHFSGKKNWINDPNGLVYYDGLYHLYFQYHPYSMFDGPKHWGHAISRDMASWIEVPIALYPDELGAIWSGCAVIDFDNTTGFKVPGGLDPLIAIYTSAGNGQKQSIAYSLDNGFTFTKYEENPVLEAPDKPDFRDPKVYWVDGQWIMALAVLDHVEFFSSPDLKTWEFESEYGRDPPEGSHGGTWECVDFVNMDVETDEGRKNFWVLLVNVGGGAYNDGGGTTYIPGQFVQNAQGRLEFVGETWHPNQWMESGPDNYASVTFFNEPKGRIIAMGWVSNFMYLGAEPNLHHRGHITIARELELYALNATTIRMKSKPVEEQKNLRVHTQHIEGRSESLAPGWELHLTANAPFTNPLLEAEINLEWEGNPVFSLCAANDLGEQICFLKNGTHWYADRSESGYIDFNDNFRSHSVLESAREVDMNNSNIKFFLDVTNIEVFADDGLSTMTVMFFPTEPFTKIFLKNHSPEGSQARVIVNDYNVWGLECWFPANEA